MNRDGVLKALETAARIDKDFVVFGAGKHKYRLNEPVSVDFVRAAEEKYGFSLPEDYFKFITEIGDGGAGVDYGLYSFAEYMEKNLPNNDYYARSRQSLGLPFEIEPLTDVTDTPVAPEFFEKHPEKCFYDKRFDDEDHDGLVGGFLVLGTRGCQYDFGMALSGEHRGRIFNTGNEGDLILLSESFGEFYGDWLGKISDEAWLKEQVGFWKNVYKR
ncbi:MAG: SMI1/KNR4 family protein [Lachnospiraceae bacterium]|nr:SMI1/KNR4 family protein [Ruminococcus sp.]MCM1276065.1 SMI1/KNR4 family protein [Lachnospiraceae bacterium]